MSSFRDKQKISVSSGSVSSDFYYKWFKTQLVNEKLGTFDTAMEGDCVLIERFLKYIGLQKYKTDRVAVLSEDRRPWSPEGELALLAFTDLAALLIAAMMQGEEQSGLALQLQGALDSRQVIEQAKGVLMERHSLAPRAAYDRLRARARAERRKLGVICAEVVDSAARGK